MSAVPSAASIAVPTALPPGFADSDLFRRWGADSLKLYIWLRSRARPAEPLPIEPGERARRGYLVADASGVELETAIGVSKNTVTKLARDLQGLGVAAFSADRAGYHFRLGEWLVRPAVGADLELRTAAFYLEALL